MKGLGKLLTKVGITAPIDNPVAQSPFAQYLECESLLNDFFGMLDYCQTECINQEKNKYYRGLPGHIGCCPSDSYKSFNTCHVPDDKIKSFRSEQESINGAPRVKDRASRIKDRECGYHTDEGCAMNFFRSPICISYVCESFETHLSEEYGIDYKYSLITENMSKILAGNLSKQEVAEFKKEIQGFVDIVQEKKSINSTETELVELVQNP